MFTAKDLEVLCRLIIVTYVVFPKCIRKWETGILRYVLRGMIDVEITVVETNLIVQP
jgi:hypothetical protein